MRTNSINVVKFILIQQTFSVYYMTKLENAKMANIQLRYFRNIKSKGGKRYKHKYSFIHKLEEERVGKYLFWLNRALKILGGNRI